MNDSMTSVADIPADPDDDLSGISPELVLVDPELAHLVRGRERALLAAAQRAQTLRLVAAQPPDAVPHGATPTHLPPGAPSASTRVAPDLAEPVPTTSNDPSPGGWEAPPALAPSDASAATAVGSRPAQAARPAPSPRPSERVERARPVWLAPTAPPVTEAEKPSPAVGPVAHPPAMPHPISRPAPVDRQPTTPVRPRPSRGRGAIALAAAVAIASIAVLGITRLDGGSPAGSSRPSETTAAPPGTPPTPSAREAARATARTRSNVRSPSPGQTLRPARTAVRARTPGAVNTRSGAATKAQATDTRVGHERAARQKAGAGGQRAPGTKRAVSGPPRTAATQAPRRFAWAPVSGAVGYRVELFNGAERVFATETTEPVLEIGPSWRYNGRTVRLTPGVYRWYVWATTEDGRATQPVAQATLSVP